MKLPILVSCLLLTLAANKANLKSKTTNKDVITPSSPGEQAFISGAYSYANADGFLLQDAAGFKTPDYVDKVNRIIHNPYTGIMTTAQAISTNKLFYDGRANLNAEHILCNNFNLLPQKCVGSASCGWCTDSNTCIEARPGNAVNNCLRKSVIYTLPSREWNPLHAGHINLMAKDAGGRNAINVVPTPSLNEIHNNSPYVY